jgi:hypothetical protein
MSIFDNGIIISICTSLLASVVVLSITEIISPYLKYKKLAGRYDVFWVKNWREGGDEIDMDKPMGEVRLKYKGKNRLEISYRQTRHDTDYSEIDHRWKGTLIMETSQNGTIAFYYTMLWGKPLDKTKHRIGFKKVICDDKRDNKNIIYLIGYRSEGYGKEVLIQRS